uniref:Uncharacterized protein n=1 Tax=Rhizophora mucronata TaxID=61149 RepID=A0A2P2J6V8_RHIMU
MKIWVLFCFTVAQKSIF